MTDKELADKLYKLVAEQFNERIELYRHTITAAAARLERRPEVEPYDREELVLLHAVLNQARETLLISIKAPEVLPSSLGKLNLACKAHYDWRTEKIKRHSMNSHGEPHGK